MIRIAVLLVSVVLAAGIAGPIAAQQAPVEPHRHPGNYAKIETLIKSLDEDGAKGTKITEYGYIFSHLRWDQGKPIMVCFIKPDKANESSAPKTVERIIALAVTWAAPDAANIKLDFGQSGVPRECAAGDGSDIRIGFDPKSPNGPRWSVIGHDVSIPKESPTANFYFDHDMLVAPAGDPLGYYFPYTILHEFGHALGLIHEHQGGDCNGEFDFTLLYNYYGWSQANIDANFRHISDSRLVTVTPYCKESVMNYVVDPAYYVRGTKSACYSPPVSQLADCDKMTARLAYPSIEAASKVAAAQARTIIWTALDPSTTRKQRGLLLGSAAEILGKAGVSAELVNPLRTAAGSQNGISDDDLRKIDLALMQLAMQAGEPGGSAAGPSAPAAAFTAPNAGEKQRIIRVMEGLYATTP